MTSRERFADVLNFKPVDRLPAIEWATWWDKTLARWYEEGLPEDLSGCADIGEHLGLDVHRQCWIRPYLPSLLEGKGHGDPVVSSRDDYEKIKPYLYPENAFDKEVVRCWAHQHKTGDCVVWLTLEGFFWYPRILFGIEPHFYAFYDYPELMKEINSDLLTFNKRVVEEFCEITVPDFMTFAEDLSYNHGPMLSKKQFDEFIAPYYRDILPMLSSKGIVPFVDTDGNVSEPMEWFLNIGVEGFLPLERMAGVDIAALRQKHPNVKMIGAFDKTVMHLGEDAMRAEFERLLPVMRQGGFIPSVDHQTPPDVSLDNYKVYVKLLKQYCRVACKDQRGKIE